MKEQTGRYFNTAATGLVPAKYLDNVRPFWAQLSDCASQANEQWYTEQLADLRNKTALFMDAETDEVAFIPNFSLALNAVVQSFPSDTRVLTLYEDYPSISDAFKLNGFPTKRLKSEKSIHFSLEDLYLTLIKDNIQILAIGQVQWLTGFKVDIPALCDFCRQHEIITIIDSTQSMGAIPISLKKSGVDVIIGSNYKWMNAGFGTGILCIQRSLLERFPPKIRGNHSRMLVGNNWTDDTSILGYEPGHLNTPGLMVLDQALDDKLHTGVERIEAHNMNLTKRFIESLANSAPLVGPESLKHRSSIIALRGGQPLFDHLSKAGYTLSFRNNLVRLSFHYHNTVDQTDELVHEVNKFVLAN